MAILRIRAATSKQSLPKYLTRNRGSSRGMHRGSWPKGTPLRGREITR